MKIRVPRLFSRATIAAVLGLGVALSSAVAAHADTAYVTYGTQAYWITAGYDGLNVAVSNGSIYPGAPLIQWYNDGAAEQKWYFDQVSVNGNAIGYLIRNENSHLCIDTDGSPGDGLFQAVCTTADPGQLFTGGFSSASRYRDSGSGWWMDISGFSYGAGATVDRKSVV